MHKTLLFILRIFTAGEGFRAGHTETRQSGCQVVEVEFHSPIPDAIGCVTFQNHYTHSLTLKFLSRSSERVSNSKSDQISERVSKSDDKWKTAIARFELMPNCHCERGSQNLIVLNRAHFLVPLDNVVCLRLILRQPSPDWHQYGIRDLKFYRVSNPFQWNGNGGMNHSSMGAGGMERVLQNGLWTETDVESGQDTQGHQYNVTTLSYT